MKFIFKKKLRIYLSILLLSIACFFIFNYAISGKIHKLYFGQKNIYNQDYVDSHDVIKIKYKGGDVNLHHLSNTSSNVNMLYVAGNDGILPNVLNSQIAENNLFILDYPKLSKFQNFKSLTEMLDLAIKEIEKQGVKAEDLILFSQKIGANVVLSYSQNKNFKAILLLNLLQSEHEFCSTFIKPIFCFMIKSSFSIEDENKNPVYFFFNENNSINLEQNFNLFNSINASEKFLFEIPGTNLNFNFNHMVQFYNNALLQDKIFEHTDEYNNSNPDSEDVIDVDGLLNPDEYID